MPLLAAMGAAMTGFLVPWRLGLEFAGRPVWLSAADAAMVVGILGGILARPRMVGRELRRRLRTPAGVAWFLLAALAAWHAARSPAATGGGPVPAMATAWAILAGLYLARLDRDATLDGLVAGVLVSAAAGLVVLPFRPDLVTEHKYFAAFCGAKNTFAFLVSLAGLHAAHRLAARRGRDAIGPGLCLAATAAILAAANARAATVALGAALFALPSAGRTLCMARGLVAIVAVMLVAGASVPWDRIHFAWAILAHADAIPVPGFGPGFGYGLDTFLKLMLELGPTGALAAAVVIADALRRRGLDSWLVLAGVTALAHDAARWPLFWMMLAAMPRSNRGSGLHIRTRM